MSDESEREIIGERLILSEEDNGRFFSKVCKIENSCWQWIGTKNNKGYGQFHFKRKHHYAHRISYEYYRRKIPKGLVIDHLCRNRACVRPQHLRIVTPAENSMCGNSVAARNAAKTHCIRGHKFSEENIRRDPKHINQRECIPCRKIFNSKRVRRKILKSPSEGTNGGR